MDGHTLLEVIAQSLTFPLGRNFVVEVFHQDPSFYGSSQASAQKQDLVWSFSSLELVAKIHLFQREPPRI